MERLREILLAEFGTDIGDEIVPNVGIIFIFSGLSPRLRRIVCMRACVDEFTQLLCTRAYHGSQELLEVYFVGSYREEVFQGAVEVIWECMPRFCILLSVFQGIRD
jgi:hypothetical protein